MSLYVPRFTPTDAGQVPAFLQQELQNIARSMGEANQFLLLDMQYAAPAKVRDGMVVLADGTQWNPGSGAGVYCYRAGSWRFLG